MTVVYLDKVFVLNWLMDYLLLLATARLGGVPLQRKRLIFCAALGALYASAIFFPSAAFLDHPIIRLVAGLMMALLAFWPLRHPGRLTVLFLLLSSAVAGLVLGASLLAGDERSIPLQLYYARINCPMLLGITAITDILLHLIFRQGARHVGGEIMKIGISVNGKEREVLALHDTGNTLRDPISAQPVLVMEQSELTDIWQAETAEILASTISPEEKIARLHRRGAGVGFTLLPYRSVGTSSGLLLAVRSDYIKVGRATYPRAWIALAEGCISDGGAYRALWGGVKRGEEQSETSADLAQMDRQTQQAG